MIGKHVVIDTLDNFKAKLDLIPSSAIVLIKDVGQIYAHGTYFGAQKTYSLLTKTADGLAPKGGTSASSLISDVNTEWVLTVTNGENPTWRKLPANAFNSSSYTLSSATTSDLGGIKVGQVYTATFDDLVGLYYKVNIDKNGLAYVHVPWVNNPYTASGSGITLKDNVFSLSLNSVSKLDSAIGNKIYAVSLDKNGKLCVSVPWIDTNNIFVGATETINGSSGMVPAPIANQHSYFLRGDGTWVKPNLSDLNDDVVNGKYLPLSGGDLTGPLKVTSTNGSWVGIEFTNKDSKGGAIGMNGSSPCFVLKDRSASYTLWHSGNDGSGSGLDADTIDGKHLSSLMKIKSLYDSDDDKLLSTKVWSAGTTGKGDQSSQKECPTQYGMYMSLQYDTSKNMGYQFYGNTANSTPTLYVRNRQAGDDKVTYNAWKEIAFTDSNVASASSVMINYLYLQDLDFPLLMTSRNVIGTAINSYIATDHGGKLTYNPKTDILKCGSFSGNASSASKLQTARTIWGQSFDGSSNVDGDFTQTKGGSYGGPYGDQNFYIYNKVTSDVPERYGVLRWAFDDHAVFRRLDIISKDFDVTNTIISFLHNGNVGIGTTNPTQPLHIVKSSTSQGDMIELNSKASLCTIVYAATSGHRWSVGCNTSDQFYFWNNYLNNSAVQFTKTGDIIAGGNKVWHAGNDGSGSGLDADLLDGYHISVGAAGTNSSTIYFVT